MYLTIKEYADQKNKTVQAVYRQIQRKEHSAALEGHIRLRMINNKEIKVLDEVAIKILDESSKYSPGVIRQKDEKEELDQLRINNHNLIIKVAELQEALLKEKDQVKLLQQEKIELLEAKTTKKKVWWQFGKGEN